MKINILGVDFMSLISGILDRLEVINCSENLLGG